MEISVSNSG